MRRPLVPMSSLLRATLLGASALMLADVAPASARVGVTSAADGDPLGKPPTEAERVLRIGVDVQANEVITTRANDRAHLVFLDGSSLTVGPDAQLTIDKFVYDPATKTGELAINASKGVLRLVGGTISKKTPITITTPSNIIGIRGGIALLDVTAVQTTSTFVFGKDMTVTGAGRTERVTRPGSQVVTSIGRVPGSAILVPVGSLDGVLAQLEGNPRPSEGQAARANSAAGADQKAQTSGFSRQNSGQGTAVNVPGGPKVVPSLGRGPDNLQSQVANALSNRNTALEVQVADARESQIVGVTSPTSTVPPTVTSPVPLPLTPTVPPIVTPNSTPTPAPTPAPTVIVTQGRFLQDPAFTGFDRSTTAAARIPENNQALAATGTVNNAIATITTADGRTFVVPWVPGQEITFNGVTSVGNGPATGLVSPKGDFFAFRFAGSNGKIFGVFGGTPTSAADLPKTGFAAHSVTEARSAGNLPFADQPIASDAQLRAVANISPMYSAYSAQLGRGLPAGVSIDQRAVSLQVTVSIAGEGANQKTYLGQYIGTYYADYNTNTYMNSGGYQAIYRVPGQTFPGRFAGAQATADTGQGNAIYGKNGEYMVFIPDSATTTGNGSTGTTVRTPVATQNLPNWANTSTTTGYYPVTLATKTDAPSDLGQTRTTQTMNGYVGGVFDRITTPGTGLVTSSRVIDVSGSLPTDVSLTTDAATNRAQATIVVRNLDAPGVTATFQLGSVGQGRPGSSSAFIDDKRYGLSDQTVDPNRVSSVQARSTSAATPIWGRTQLTSYAAAPVALPGGVKPCECAFMSWGWWTGEVQYFNPNNPSTGYNLSVKDRLNLAGYVVGTLSNVVDLPRTGTATYIGHAVGNVVNGADAYVAAGSYNNSWNFASQTGQVRISNFDGTTYTGTTALKQGTVNFTGAIGGGSRSGTLNGSFFSSPTDPIKGQGGNFAVTGPANYKAGGIFAGQK